MHRMIDDRPPGTAIKLGQPWIFGLAQFNDSVEQQREENSDTEDLEAALQLTPSSTDTRSNPPTPDSESPADAGQ